MGLSTVIYHGLVFKTISGLDEQLGGQTDRANYTVINRFIQREREIPLNTLYHQQYSAISHHSTIINGKSTSLLKNIYIEELFCTHIFDNFFSEKKHDEVQSSFLHVVYTYMIRVFIYYCYLYKSFRQLYTPFWLIVEWSKALVSYEAIYAVPGQTPNNVHSIYIKKNTRQQG